MSVGADRQTAAERMCECGHASDWHSHGGGGSCEHDVDCRCVEYAVPSLLESRYRKLADDFVQACEDAYDLCEALGDEAPALAWMLAERDMVGAKFQDALGETKKLEAVRQAAAEEGREQEQDENLCKKPMRGLYGAQSICALPAGHLGQHNSI